MASVNGLAYLGFEVSRMDAWHALLTDVLGFAAAGTDPDGTRAYRMDENARRVILRQGPSDDVAFMGWQVDSRPALDEMAARLGSAGIAVARGTASEAAARAVEAFIAFSDPDGIRVELCASPKLGAELFRPSAIASGFVTGDQGMGHVLIGAAARERSERFYRDLLGLKLTDYVETVRAGRPLNATFLHANPRHHSIALAEGAMAKKLHHFMMEVRAIDDVGQAFDRCQDAGVPIVRTIGRHENDQMISFYAATPSGFAFEVGWGGRRIDDRTWKPTLWHKASEWGHRAPAAS